MDAGAKPHRFNALGPPELVGRGGERVRSVLAQPKRVALLAYLCLAQDGKPVSRSAVLATFWPDVPEERALNALRQAIHFLRRSLGPGCVERTGDHLLSVPRGEVACDVDLFDARLAAEDPSGALALYRGPFLEGIDAEASGSWALEEWIEGLRRRYRGAALEAACSLAERAMAEGDHVAAVERAEEARGLDPLSERAVATLVEAQVRAGNVAGAAEAFRAYGTRLQEMLDLEPSAEFAARVEALLQSGSGQGAGSVSTSAEPTPSAGPTATTASAGDSSPGPRGSAVSRPSDGLRGRRVRRPIHSTPILFRSRHRALAHSLAPVGYGGGGRGGTAPDA